MYTLTQNGEYVGVPTSMLIAISESKELLRQEAYKDLRENYPKYVGAKFDGDTLEIYPGEEYTIDSIEPLVYRDISYGEK